MSSFEIILSYIIFINENLVSLNIFKILFFSFYLFWKIIQIFNFNNKFCLEKFFQFERIQVFIYYNFKNIYCLKNKI